MVAGGSGLLVLAEAGRNFASAAAGADAGVGRAVADCGRRDGLRGAVPHASSAPPGDAGPSIIAARQIATTSRRVTNFAN
jgi:hypothetical protein